MIYRAMNSLSSGCARLATTVAAFSGYCTLLIVDDQLRLKGYLESPDEVTELVLGVLLAGLRP